MLLPALTRRGMITNEVDKVLEKPVVSVVSVFISVVEPKPAHIVNRVREPGNSEQRGVVEVANEGLMVYRG